MCARCPGYPRPPGSLTAHRVGQAATTNGRDRLYGREFVASNDVLVSEAGPERLPRGDTPEARYWKRFRDPINHQLGGSIASIHFCPSRPHDFAVSSSSRVVIYSAQTAQVKKTISRFSDNVYSGSFRDDGRLLVAGGEDPVVKVFNLANRQICGYSRTHALSTLHGLVTAPAFSPARMTKLFVCGTSQRGAVCRSSMGTRITCGARHFSVHSLHNFFQPVLTITPCVSGTRVRPRVLVRVQT